MINSRVVVIVQGLLAGCLVTTDATKDQAYEDETTKMIYY